MPSVRMTLFSPLSPLTHKKKPTWSQWKKHVFGVVLDSAERAWHTSLDVQGGEKWIWEELGGTREGGREVWCSLPSKWVHFAEMWSLLFSDMP